MVHCECKCIGDCLIKTCYEQNHSPTKNRHVGSTKNGLDEKLLFVEMGFSSGIIFTEMGFGPNGTQTRR
ncbi:hypothetical protein HanIR_Chr08g0372571 [Helianthus annuus]|nr:hypothetical protein HanIR_Chr08g0372571 [Helianthus annuus]